MSNIRKLSAFRQLSLNCSPTPEQRRKTLKKQFSEDIPDYKEKWIDPGIGIKISLNTKTSRNLDRPPPIRIAWEENTPQLKAEDAVIIKKCKEVRRGSTGKLSKQNSLEKNSILHSKHELTERFKQNVKEKEPEKTNLKIFLAHNPKEQADEIYSSQQDRDTEQYLEKNYERPKLIQPLMSNVSNNSKNLFQIRRNFKPKINLAEIAYSPTRSSEVDTNIARNDTVVVVPMVEKEQLTPKQGSAEQLGKDDLKPIDSIIIRPVTAASKREKFQKRTNSAFNNTINESPHNRPPLIRSSSAPSKSERGRQKFSATKRKIKTIKRVHLKTNIGGDEIEENACNKENPKSQKVLNRTAVVNGSEIVTMVSLVSPAGSDAEEETEKEETKEKCKNKTANVKNAAPRDERESPKNMSLRKTVKSVSFQQSSIHAIRSFSASFPGRRGSVATALMLGNNSKTNLHSTKAQEKRSTNSNTPDDDERVPKRRLLRSDTQEKQNPVSSKEPKHVEQNDSTDTEEKPANEPNFSVAIKTKTIEEVDDSTPATNGSKIQTEAKVEIHPEEVVKVKDDAKYESQKEKQCWDLYCKMTEKGINVSFDTILRGMLTPTEYRISRKNNFVPEPEEPNAC
ncbi:uncharacterized protein LOC108913757 [Anoplophora glabripennis]|uniref:uncharacterized protein LOC108913757 n=1 Tax=Anoplophora glabripennis TaxID=217634 RepID=UPI00087379D4|nr:uncharacterized protein LOC108913757 [Anoplophora glabripennis]